MASKTEDQEAVPELPTLEMPDMPVSGRSVRDLWPTEGFEEFERPIGEALEPELEEPGEPESSEEPQAAETPEEPQAEELPSLDAEPEEELPSTEEGMTMVDELPEVITADMLRARKKGIDFSDEDFEVPAELLVGLEDEDLDGEDEEEQGKGKRKAKGKAKRGAKSDAKSRGKKWRPVLEEDDDL